MRATSRSITDHVARVEEIHAPTSVPILEIRNNSFLRRRNLIEYLDQEAESAFLAMVMVMNELGDQSPIFPRVQREWQGVEQALALVKNVGIAKPCHKKVGAR